MLRAGSLSMSVGTWIMATCQHGQNSQHKPALSANLYETAITPS